MQGTYLKHIKYSFRAETEATQALRFVRYLVGAINMTPVYFKLIRLPPGFDIIAIIKQSHISFSYWPEINLAIMDISSCRNFNEETVTTHIKKIFKVDRLKVTVVQNCSVFDELRQIQDG